MSVLYGEATVFSLDGMTVAFSGVATTQNEPTGLSLRASFDKVDVMGSGGRTISRGGADERHTLTVDVTFKADQANPTRAQGRATPKLPGKFAIVTLDAFGNTLFDGDWNYEDGSLAITAKGDLKATLTLSRMEKADGTMGAMTAIT